MHREPVHAKSCSCQQRISLQPTLPHATHVFMHFRAGVLTQSLRRKRKFEPNCKFTLGLRHRYPGGPPEREPPGTGVQLEDLA